MLIRCCGRLRGQIGQDLAEYALLLALVAIMMVGALLLIGDADEGIYQSIIDRWPS
jgi:Flp pilus assembly pilin Flp